MIIFIYTHDFPFPSHLFITPIRRTEEPWSPGNLQPRPLGIFVPTLRGRWARCRSWHPKIASSSSSSSWNSSWNSIQVHHDNPSWKSCHVMPFRPTAHPHISQKERLLLGLCGYRVWTHHSQPSPSCQDWPKKTAASTAETIAAVWKD